MIQENEAIVLLLGIGGLIFIQANRLRLKDLPESQIIIAGYCMLLTGWVLTVLEGFIWKETLNFIEHVCYAGSAALMATWCWKVFGKEEEQR